MPPTSPRCRLIPLPDHQVAFVLDDTERLGWHFGRQYPRPFFFPLRSPSGSSLTRMGHPGAPNHDHHRSIWFAHEKTQGVDFWSDNTEARIRQHQWLAYEDDENQAIMAVRLGWYENPAANELLTQELIAAVRPVSNGETFLEVQSTFVPTTPSLEFGRTNFGFFAVRVAKHISAHFGGGQLTNSEGRQGESEVFGQAARWMDYSGPVPGQPSTFEGITYYDHPVNPGQPTRWHVREDGWMGASPCMRQPLTTSQAEPLVLRYLLHAHVGKADNSRAELFAQAFADSPPLEVVPTTEKHRTMRARRVGARQ